MANGKVKGNSYERAISRKLSLWISNNERDDLFWRTQGSGGRHTVRYKSNLTLEGQAGDISSTQGGISENFLKFFCVEVKFYKDINIWAIITKSKNGLLDFWDQATLKAKQVNRIPILIVKENYKPALFISNEVFEKMLVENFKEKPELKVNLFNSDSISVWKLDTIMKLNSEKFMVSLIRWEKEWKES